MKHRPKKVGFGRKNLTKTTEKNDFRVSVHNLGYGIFVVLTSKLQTAKHTSLYAYVAKYISVQTADHNLLLVQVYIVLYFKHLVQRFGCRLDA